MDPNSLIREPRQFLSELLGAAERGDTVSIMRDVEQVFAWPSRDREALWDGMAIDPNCGNLIWTLGDAIAVLAFERREPGLWLAALRAIALDDFRHDAREQIRILSVLDQIAPSLGIDARRESKAVARQCGPHSKQAILQFWKRHPSKRAPGVMGLRVRIDGSRLIIESTL